MFGQGNEINESPSSRVVSPNNRNASRGKVSKTAHRLQSPRRYDSLARSADLERLNEYVVAFHGQHVDDDGPMVGW